MRPIVSSVACSVLVCVVQKRMNRSLAGFEGHIRMGPRSRVLDGGGSGSHHEGALLRGGGIYRPVVTCIQTSGAHSQRSRVVNETWHKRARRRCGLTPDFFARLQAFVNKRENSAASQSGVHLYIAYWSVYKPVHLSTPCSRNVVDPSQ